MGEFQQSKMCQFGSKCLMHTYIYIKLLTLKFVSFIFMKPASILKPLLFILSLGYNSRWFYRYEKINCLKFMFSDNREY